MFESLHKPDPTNIEVLKAKVRSAIVPLEVELGTAIVAVQDLLGLAVGDVNPLDARRLRHWILRWARSQSSREHRDA